MPLSSCYLQPVLLLLLFAPSTQAAVIYTNSSGFGFVADLDASTQSLELSMISSDMTSSRSWSFVYDSAAEISTAVVWSTLSFAMSQGTDIAGRSFVKFTSSTPPMNITHTMFDSAASITLDDGSTMAVTAQTLRVSFELGSWALSSLSTGLQLMIKTTASAADATHVDGNFAYFEDASVSMRSVWNFSSSAFIDSSTSAAMSIAESGNHLVLTLPKFGSALSFDAFIGFQVDAALKLRVTDSNEVGFISDFNDNDGTMEISMISANTTSAHHWDVQYSSAQEVSGSGSWDLTFGTTTGVDTHGRSFVMLSSSSPPMTITHTMYTAASTFTLADSSTVSVAARTLRISFWLGNWSMSSAATGLKLRFKLNSNSADSSFTNGNAIVMDDATVSVHGKLSFLNDVFVGNNMTAMSMAVAKSGGNIVLTLPKLSQSLTFDALLTAELASALQLNSSSSALVGIFTDFNGNSGGFKLFVTSDNQASQRFWNINYMSAAEVSTAVQWNAFTFTTYSGVDVNGRSTVNLTSSNPPMVIVHTLFTTTGTVTFPDHTTKTVPMNTMKISMYFGAWGLSSAATGMKLNIQASSSFGDAAQLQDGTLVMGDASSDAHASMQFDVSCYVDSSSTAQSVSVSYSGNIVTLGFPKFSSSMFYDPVVSASADNTLLLTTMDTSNNGFTADFSVSTTGAFTLSLIKSNSTSSRSWKVEYHSAQEMSTSVSWSSFTFVTTHGTDGSGNAYVTLTSTTPPMVIQHTLFDNAGFHTTLGGASVHVANHTLKISISLGDWSLSSAATGLFFNILTTSSAGDSESRNGNTVYLEDGSVGRSSVIQFESNAYADGSTSGQSVSLSMSSGTITLGFPKFSSTLWYDPTVTSQSTSANSASAAAYTMAFALVLLVLIM